MEKHLEVLNNLLVETFNEILKIEERSLRLVAGSDVTVNEVHTLDAIGKYEPGTVSELASAMMVTVSTMTIAINRLERRDWYASAPATTGGWSGISYGQRPFPFVCPQAVPKRW